MLQPTGANIQRDMSVHFARACMHCFLNLLDVCGELQCDVWQLVALLGRACAELFVELLLDRRRYRLFVAKLTFDMRCEWKGHITLAAGGGWSARDACCKLQ